MHLVIISHTEHYITADGTVVGWGPTVTEINHLVKIVDSITHIGMLHQNTPPPSALPYTSSNIKFVSLPPLGGESLSAKLKLLWKAPLVLKIIRNQLKTADCFQLRTPTGIGVYLIPYLTWFIRKKGWYKYAGNWNQKKPPLGYAIQRGFLKIQTRPVTINGVWSKQPKHCFSFENPCLTMDEVEMGWEIAKTKTITQKLNLCYVGRLETPKGVGRILEALNLLGPVARQRIGTVHLVGDGTEITKFKEFAQKLDMDIRFHGFLPREKVFEIYRQCQVFVMPTTASEGFPKVLAEAMNFGCIPVVSNISSIGHYIKQDKQGFLMQEPTPEVLFQIMNKLQSLEQNKYIEILKNQREIVNKFTFEHYNKKVTDLILEK